VRCLIAALLVAGAGARAEQIRIQIGRGARAASVESAGRRHEVTVRGDALFVDGAKAQSPAEFGGPLKLDGRELGGRLELFVDKGALLAVNAVDLEEYVAAVVASEVSPAWPAEALKAQAVAARTFAAAQKISQGAGARAHLGASVLDQVYKGTAHPEPAALQAARDTAGEVLTYGSAPIAAYFSASCGGKSESAEAAFHLAPGTTPYLRGGEADLDEREWTRRIPLSEITASLRKASRIKADVQGLRVSARTASGRARTMALQTEAGPRSLPAVELRQLVGYTELPSLFFDVSAEGETAVFHGKGSGHGVGLCQWGANLRAKRGDGYREILTHYYPGAEIRRMY
jgi:stage II sporulation protein D